MKKLILAFIIITCPVLANEPKYWISTSMARTAIVSLIKQSKWDDLGSLIEECIGKKKGSFSASTNELKSIYKSSPDIDYALEKKLGEYFYKELVICRYGNSHFLFLILSYTKHKKGWILSGFKYSSTYKESDFLIEY